MTASVSSLTTGQDTSGATSSSTASVSPAANDLILLSVVQRTGITADPTQPTATGNGLTWVVVSTVVYDTTTASRRRITVFRAAGASPSTGSITLDYTGQAQTDVCWSVEQFSGADTSGTNGSGAVVQSANAIEETSSTTWPTATLAAFGSANNATFGAGGNADVGSEITAASGFTITNAQTSTNNRFATEFRADNSTAVTFTTATTSTGKGVIGIEIKVAPVPTINTQPVSQIGNVGGTATFTIAATTSGGTLHYQWKDDGSNVGTDSSSYTTGTLANSDQWAQITCDVTDDNGTTVSEAAQLTVAFGASGAGPQRRNIVGAYPVGTLRWQGVVSASSGSTGTLATTNANDTLAGTGSTTVTGALARTNANDTLAGTGSTTVTGTLARTNANDTIAASGSPIASGTLATTNANDTLAASGTVGGTVTGTLATTNVNDTLAASGSTTVTGALARTNANDALAAVGATTVTGSLTYTNNNDTLAASGSIGGAVDGSLSYTNNDDTLVASGIVTGASASVSGAPGRFMRRFSAEINGKFYYFDSLAELQAVLNSFKTKQKKKIAKKVERAAIPVTIPHVEVPVHIPMWAAQEIEKTNKSLEAYYWQQYELLMNQDDEEAIVALYG